MKLYRQIAACRREDAALPAGIRQGLIDGLYTPFASLAVGALSGTIIAVAAALSSHRVELTACAAAIGIVGSLRVLVAHLYIRRRPAARVDYRLWEYLYAIGGFAFAGLLSLCALLTFGFSDNIALQVITSTAAIGYGAGISGRNAGRPIIAVGQLLLSSLPLSLMLIASGDLRQASLGIVILLFAYGMVDITMSVRAIVVTALVTTRDKAALADRFKAQADLFDIALNTMSHGLCMFDTRGRLKVWNARFLEITGLDATRVKVGMSVRTLFGRCGTAGIEAASEVRASFAQLQTSLWAGSAVLQLPDERFVSLVQRRSAHAEWVVIFEDVTARKCDEARIAKMARYDELTALPNRSSFRAHVEAALAHGREFAIHLIDLDRFKAVNDTKGHPVGDRLLQCVADRLRAAACGPNQAFRIGGDEFVLVQRELDGLDDAERLCAEIIRLLEEPFRIDGVRIAIGASIGTALAPVHADDADRLLKCADIALYAAKADGRNNGRTFQPAMETATQARHAIEADLRSALAAGEFELHYQPLVDLATGAIVSCEALLRWNHPQRGPVSPLEFIAIAEETGLIVPIGEWVLNEACREAAAWPDEIGVAVNLSPVQFNTATLAFQVLRALQRSGLPAHRLDLEITESVTLDGSDQTLAIFESLKALGVRLALDDFGTGYSSLGYLTRYAFDKLKVDRAFVTNLASRTDSVAIMRAMVGMGHSLGMTIVVEGVETESQRAILTEERCDLGQGYYFSRPLPAAALRALLDDGAWLIRAAA